MMGMALPFQVAFEGSEWIVLILASVLFFMAVCPFLKGAVSELKEKRPTMMTLISLGIIVAYFYSVYAFISAKANPATPTRWTSSGELATLIDIMLLGHWIEMNAVMNAGNAMQKMAELLPEQRTRS